MLRAAALAVLALLGLGAPAAAAPVSGSLERPLDAGTLRVAYRFYPARAHPSGPPIVAVEGGPGYPSIGSRVEYLGTFGALVRDRGLLLMDQRGTGGSGLLDCSALQRFAGRTSGGAFARRVGRCGRSIAGRDDYATADAVDDLAAVIRHLRLGRVDLYGDSYGTYFVQSFMARHPALLHSVVLDSAYPVRGLDPWYASSGTAARAALETVAPGSVARLAQLLAAVRARPVAGATRDADGSALRVRVDPRALADMVQDAGSDPVILRELDGAVQAALAGDRVPLLRLAGQSHTSNHSAPAADYFSDALYMAVACADYPQLFSLAASPAQRRAQLAARTAPAAFAPFTGPEWLSISGYSQPYDVCLDWPRPRHVRPAIPPGAKPVRAPLLVLGGDLDSLTPLADARALAPALSTDAHVVTLRNTVHVTSEGDTFLADGARCARTVIRSFLRGALDGACGDSIPAVHVASYPRTLGAAAPAVLVAGPDPGESARRAATVAAGALADATIRRYYSGADHGPGLRGGHFTAVGERFTLHGVRFVADARVDGAGRFHAPTGAADGTFTVGTVRVHVHWTQHDALATATIGGATLTLAAP